MARLQNDSSALQLVARVGAREVRATLGPDPLTLGSAPDCDLVLEDPTVSRRHARIQVRDGTAWIEDLGSRNGTRIDGVALVGTASIADGAALRLGDVPIRLQRLAPGDTEVAQGAAADAPRSGAAARTAQPTQAGAGLLRFCLQELPSLLHRLADDSASRFHEAVLAALARTEPDAGFSLSRRDARHSVLARVGSESHPRFESQRADLVLEVSHPDAQAESSLRPLVELAMALVAAAERIPGAPRPAALPARPATEAAPVTACAALREIYWQAARVAPSRLNVLVHGETGTGKELLARFLHRHSGEPADRFLVLNCAALPPDLIDAELFGIEAGIATGVQARPGRFELAHGGSLFLDEIGDMAPETQARILRVLQEREVYRVGSHRARPADVRVISASHRDLDALVRDGRFRRDLYHRIADWHVTLPPLRERREDIAGLALEFLRAGCATRGIESGGLSRAVVERLAAYPWPGNVRELEREMQRVALFLEPGEVVTSALLKPELREARADSEDATLARRLEQAERQMLAEALAACGGRVAEAAQRLGVSKATLYRRIGHLGLSAQAPEAGPKGGE